MIGHQATAELCKGKKLTLPDAPVQPHHALVMAAHPCAAFGNLEDALFAQHVVAWQQHGWIVWRRLVPASRVTTINEVADP